MADINQLGVSAIPIELITTLGFYIIAGLYVLFTAVFYYHWKTYSTDEKVTNLTYVLYFITTLPLIIVMGVLLLTII